ncbi:hypothetical protein BH23CHL7_BH23CHL7_14720 [soil metagenome]
MIILPWLRRPAQRLIMPDWLAITIGPLILAWRPLDAVELEHELEHVRQWRRHGLAFIPHYFAASRSASGAGGDRYQDNRFEIDARAAAARVAARLAAARQPPEG